MTKAEYIESLNEIVEDEIFITKDISSLEVEISQNCWSISATQELADQLNADDLESVFQRIKINRQYQLANSDVEVDLIFYIWHDKQASQLKFNPINSNHDKLPFGSKIKLATSLASVIEEFLNSEHHDGIPPSEFEEIVSHEPHYPGKNELYVYQEIFKK
jgi:hypothetical protein